jgi:hypothetical protein
MPHGEAALTVYAAAHMRSSNPPDPKIKYQIEASLDGGKTWQPVVKDWTINRRGDEPADFWSQSLCWGSLDLPKDSATSKVRVRFRNDGGKAIARAEMHLAYGVKNADATEVAFAWSDDTGTHSATHRFAGKDADKPWQIPTGKGVRTQWMEFRSVP